MNRSWVSGRGGVDPFEGVVDRRRLRRADVDRQQPLAPGLLAQQDHRRVGGHLDPDPDELQRHHGRRWYPAPVGADVAARAPAPAASDSRYWRSAARIIAARSLAPSASSSSSWAARLARACGLRWRSTRQDQLLVQPGLALDRRPPRPQVAGIDAGAQEPAGGRGDLDRVVAVEVAGARALA